jgi:chemotaxis protein MotB
MARRKHRPEHDNHERWLVSYADFITLLFAFFVMMFANSEMNKDKAKAISDSVTKAFEQGKMPTALAGILGGPRPYKPRPDAPAATPPKVSRGGMAELLPSLEYLSVQLKAEIDAGQMTLSMEPRGLVVTLREAAFFQSGDETINTSAHGSLAKVADAIRKLPNPVRLEGHTDSVPIRNTRFRSNWDLSAARSIAVLELFTTTFQIPRERLAIAGYAETTPVDSNDTAEGRAHNRRVDIVILNSSGWINEPKPAAKQSD